MTTFRCTYCRRPIAGRYAVNDWGEHYCAGHLDEWPRCTFCGRLVVDDDGAARHRVAAHPRCGHCAAVAIEDAGIAQAIVGDMIGWLRDEGLTLDRPVRFTARLVERHDLRDPGEERPDALGIAFTIRRGTAPIRLDIRLLRGMPSPLFEGVTVHELGHAWLACREVTGLPKWANEGFCEWISHRWYRRQGTRDAAVFAARIEQDDDPVYGGGFRRLRNLEARLGFASIIAHLVTRKALPR